MKALATFFAIAATSAFAGRVPFLPETAPTNDTPVAVRVLGNNMPIVRGEVDGKPCTLLFDTGATHTTLDKGFVERELKDHKIEKVVLAGVTNVEEKRAGLSVHFAANDRHVVAEDANRDRSVVSRCRLGKKRHPPRKGRQSNGQKNRGKRLHKDQVKTFTDGTAAADGFRTNTIELPSGSTTSTAFPPSALMESFPSDGRSTRTT